MAATRALVPPATIGSLSAAFALADGFGPDDDDVPSVDVIASDEVVVKITGEDSVVLLRVLVDELFEVVLDVELLLLVDVVVLTLPRTAFPQGIASPVGCVAFGGGVVAPVVSAIAKRPVQKILAGSAAEVNW